MTQNEVKKLSEQTPFPTVYCPKEKKRVPVYYCLGSFIQRRKTCPDLIEITVRPTGDSEVKCKAQKRGGKSA